MKRSIKINKFVEDLGPSLPLYVGEKETMDIDISDLNRPGLQISDFFEYLPSTASSFSAWRWLMQNLSAEVRRERGGLFQSSHSLILIARNLTPPEEFLEITKNTTSLFSCPD